MCFVYKTLFVCLYSVDMLRAWKSRVTSGIKLNKSICVLLVAYDIHSYYSSKCGWFTKIHVSVRGSDKRLLTANFREKD